MVQSLSLAPNEIYPLQAVGFVRSSRRSFADRRLQAASMTQPGPDGNAAESIQKLPAAATSKHKPPDINIRATSDGGSLPASHSEPNLPYRKPNPAAPLYASTFSPPGSRPGSPAPSGPRNSLRVFSSSVFESSIDRPLPDTWNDGPGEPLSLILQAFVPHISIHASDDTEALVKGKGLYNGLWELLRPFGEKVQGKVTIRDSNGISRPADDFSVRFTPFGENIEHPEPNRIGFRGAQAAQSENGTEANAARDRKTLADVERVLERHLSFAEDSFRNMSQHGVAVFKQGLDLETSSPYYALYLRRLLSEMPIVPHETFAHPVACVIAISSSTQEPIEDLRKLYAETSQGEKRLPGWVDGDYLRYYVLIHDEENDDIQRSMGFFDQMKRHLGLHCHMLRLRSTRSAESDDDSVPLPRSDWMTAEEELMHLEKSADEDSFQDPTRYIFESDAMAIRTFIREMVTQSVIPTMERRISTWNDQVASRRRGFTSRFMNLSKKWTGFGGSGRSSTGSSSSLKDNYNLSGFYQAEQPEAVMRKLADYAFMLRDWRLAQSTYELVRSDFSDSKAWKYHAAANEMAAVSLLMLPQQLSSKTRSETIDQMLESALYSYVTRCNAPYGAMRSLILSLELLRLRGGTNIDDAGRWGLRILESRILGPIGDALVKERLAICYASKQEVGSWNGGGRRRKSAAWSVLASDSWARQCKYVPAQRCLNEAHRMYASLLHKQGISRFTVAKEYMDDLGRQLEERLHLRDESANEAGGGRAMDSQIDEESEALTDTKARRTSILVRPGALETAPLHGENMGIDGTNEGQLQNYFD